jgi:CheY-like chemotaxis protein
MRGMPAPSPAAPRPRVLLVDDDASVARALERALRAEFDVEVLTSPRAALARLRAGPPPDVLLVDVLMPELSGLDLRDALAAEAPDVAERLVFMSGGIADPDFADRLAATPNRKLDKPLNVRELRAFLRAFSAPPPAR